MDFDTDYDNYKEILSEIDLFLNQDQIENANISIHSQDFNYLSFKLPTDTAFDIETLYSYLEEENENKLYVITTLVTYMDSPELKKYLIPSSRLNEFLYQVNDPEFEENVISINIAEDR